jgi:sugar phosphate isomerase/epimerase
MSNSPVFIVASAYGAQVVERHGQPFLASMAAQSGASGFEIRRELFPESDVPLDQLRRAIKESDLIAVYSAPAPWAIWTSDGKLNRKGVVAVFDEAKQSGASYVKLPLGFYDPLSSDVDELGNCLKEVGHEIQLTVENDPTAIGGNLRTLRSFFENCSRKGIPVRMTFDFGNWSWSDEDVFEAAEALADYVVYLHCKEVEDRSARTGPISEDANAAWRHLLARFPRELPRGGEFPIVGDDLGLSTKQYIRMLSVA